NSVCVGANQPVHTYGSSVTVGVNSHTLATSGGAGNVLVDDTNTADCNNDGISSDFDGDFDAGVGGGFFGSTNAWDVADGCGYDLNVHTSTGTVTDITSLPVSGNFGVDDVAGPIPVSQSTGEFDQPIDDLVAILTPLGPVWGADDTPGGLDNTLDTLVIPLPEPVGPIALGDLSESSTVTSCQTDGSITPLGDANDSLAPFTTSWKTTDPAPATTAGGYTTCPRAAGEDG